MENKSVFLVVCLLASAFAAPQPEEQAIDIENSDGGYFYQNTRIVGGENAPDGGVTHIGAMSSGTLLRSLVCGGSLVSSRHFLTAAHCIAAVRSCGIISGCSLVNSLRIHLGSNRWNSGSTAYTLSRDIMHPDYNSNQIKNDIGLLITTSNVVFNDRVQPVGLSFDHVEGDKDVVVAGWGRIVAGGSLPSDLKWNFLKTLGGQECAQRVNEFAIANNVNAPPIDPSIEICTFHSVGQGTCNGDSGSPLVLVESGLQVGAVSWGFPCAIGAPDMFARVSGFQDFILAGLETL